MTSYFRSECFDLDKVRYSLMQNNVHISGKWSKSKPKVDFQYGGRLFFKNGSSYISAINWVDEIWFDHWLWPSEGSDINKCKTGNSIASIWTSYRFIKMAAAAAQYYFWFRICWCRCLQKVKVYEQTRFSWHLNWWLRYIYFRFCKTNVRHIGNLLSISISISTICQKSAHYSVSDYTELCPDRSTHCGNMTSYPFLKMAAATAEYYFRFRICWCHCLNKLPIDRAREDEHFKPFLGKNNVSRVVLLLH